MCTSRPAWETGPLRLYLSRWPTVNRSNTKYYVANHIWMTSGRRIHSMRSGKVSRVFLKLLTVALLLLPVSVEAATRVKVEQLDDWFYSRLLWGGFIGALAGVVVSLTHLCRLRFAIGELQVNRQARRKFLLYLTLLLAVAGSLLLVDAWALYPFDGTSLQFSEAFEQVWMNYRTLVVLLCTLGLFSVTVALATRLKSNCRCRYAFLPGPQGKEAGSSRG